ncbi:MAG: Asp-tRNA(Asn)/Glu-tRNA(Gln) amidotransferase subunit GatA [Candidatus Vogelbacteria bacterium]|nr:Asp-tRNA(Asn)/Glu-tRNA(Gln) amidotransferase subunit GatA [Candidatus Vogelbacteria bacterium]
MLDLNKLTIEKAHAGLLAGDFTAVELTQSYLNAIKEKNGELNAYLEVFADALDQAKAVDEKIARKEEISILGGIPLAIKDNMLIKGRVSSSGSKILENYRAVYDATVIEKLKAKEAIFLGRTNMDEFAMGGSGENSAYGPTKNPHDLTRVPGGSSSGSAAAVGGNLALAALGSDTGGSIRQPAALCGVVGLKPTYGTVSRYGLVAMASSLDQIGPIAKTVGDAEILFNAIKGKDPNDSTSLDSSAYPKQKEKMRIGIPESYLAEGVDEEVLKNFYESVHKFRDYGYEIVDVDLSVLKYSLACYYVLMPAEASTNLARFDGLRYGNHKDGADLLGDYLKTRGTGFGPEVRRRILLGTYVLSAGYYDAYYHKANDVRHLIRQAYDKVFADVDIIVTPTSPTPAWLLGEKTADPLKMYLEDIFTVPANLTGLPAISVPSGKTSTGLPLGIQIMAPHFREDLLFSFGKRFAKL